MRKSKVSNLADDLLADMLDSLGLQLDDQPKKKAGKTWVDYEVKCELAGIDFSSGFVCWNCRSSKYRDRPFTHGVARDCDGCNKIQYFLIWNKEIQDLPHPSHPGTEAIPTDDDPKYQEAIEARKRAAEAYQKRV
jgi:hypothetical protein